MEHKLSTEIVKGIGYKKCRGDKIVKLEILGKHNEMRPNVADNKYAKFRCEKAKVLQIYDMHDVHNPVITYRWAQSIEKKNFYYIADEIMETKFNEDITKVCSKGIHYFLTEEAAFYYDYEPHNGMSKSYYDNGQLHAKVYYKNGELHGLQEYFHENGNLVGRYKTENGLRQGKYEIYYDNGKLYRKTFLRNGVPVGEDIFYFENGDIMERSTYANDRRVGVWEIYNSDGSIKFSQVFNE